MNISDVDLSGIALGETTPARLVDALTGAALVVPFVVVLPAILEELGWRGFGAQTADDGLPFWPLPIVLLAGSVLQTWIYLRTGSVFLAGLMHACLNATVPLTWGWTSLGVAGPGRCARGHGVAVASVEGWRWWPSLVRT